MSHKTAQERSHPIHGCYQLGHMEREKIFLPKCRQRIRLVTQNMLCSIAESHIETNFLARVTNVSTECFPLKAEHTQHCTAKGTGCNNTEVQQQIGISKQIFFAEIKKKKPG